MCSLNFSKCLKLLREKKGLSQRQLSKELQLSAMMIRDYESGVKLPLTTTADKIAKYFEIDEKYFSVLLYSQRYNTKKRIIITKNFYKGD